MNWWHYLLLVNIYLLLFYGFYALLLRKETFFQLNRIYLVGASILSFIAPLLQPERVKHLVITEQLRAGIYGPTINIYAYRPVANNPLTIGEVLMLIYFVGISFLLLRFIFQLVRVNKLIRSANANDAYTFFNKISLGGDLAGQDAVMAHEQVHARQLHSVDTLLIEAVMIINWFNPVVYLYRFAIKRIHEFIADQQALSTGADKKQYALLLLSQTFSAPSHQLINPFYNSSLLKQRIMMIQKNRSQRVLLLKYVLSAPLFGLMLILSAATVNTSKAIDTIHTKAGNLFRETAVEKLTIIPDNGKIPASNIPKEEPVAIAEIMKSEAPAPVTVADTTHVYTSVEHDPMYQGGIDAFYQFMRKEIKYPAIDRKNMITGKVFVQFIVEKDGSLSHIVALRGPSETTKAEAVRALKLSPKWVPGTQNGKKVRVQYTVPINFALDDEKHGDIGVRSTKVAPMPLLIVDGVEYKGSIRDIGAENIKSIELLKDAAAEKLYHEKAVNGVMVITTKKGPEAKKPAN